MDKSEIQKNDERRNSRVNSLNFVSYYYVDEEQVEIEEIGRTLDVSLGGIKLEVPSSKLPSSDISLRIALEEFVINVKGEIAHIESKDNGFSDIGIRFTEISESDLSVIKRFLPETK